MKFEAFEGEATNLSCDLLAVPCFAEKLGDNSVFAALDARLGGVLTRAAEDERFEGKPGQSLTLHSHGKVGATRILLVGVGPRADVQVPEIRHVAARAARLGRGLGAKHVGVVLHGGFAGERGAQHAAEGALLGNYKFDRYLSADSRRPDVLEKVSVVGAEAADQFARAASRAEIVAAAICRARDYINEPAGEMTPVRMAAEAERIAQKHGLGVEVLGPAECRSLGMGMFLGVAQGSDQEPRFIHLSYKPKGTAQKRVAIIGKGVTFDSGGLSLKPSQAMEDMKVDMSGAAAVISAMAAIAELAPSVEIHAIAACTENMPSGNSYKLGDVLKSMDGKTVEINNTDAEGRLTLGDAITFAKRLSPDEIIDFATLTGACVVALGPHTAGVMTNHQPMADRWLAAAKSSGEDMWQLPLLPRLREQLKSEIADMRNTGERFGGALTAGLFLKEFVGDTHWVHVDIAGPASADKEWGAIPVGGTGFAVATIVEYLTR
jgi:leucyl aminopeptidase